MPAHKSGLSLEMRSLTSAAITMSFMIMVERKEFYISRTPSSATPNGR